jgi:hypothetical protein
MWLVLVMVWPHRWHDYSGHRCKRCHGAHQPQALVIRCAIPRIQTMLLVVKQANGSLVMEATPPLQHVRRLHVHVMVNLQSKATTTHPLGSQQTKKRHRIWFTRMHVWVLQSRWVDEAGLTP